LHRPVHRNVEKFEQSQYISIYEGLDAHNEVVLKLAKLDFNIVQSMYQEELRSLTEWWIELDLARKLPFFRDRLVECFLWGSGPYPDPELALSRRIGAKSSQIWTVIDDMYDAYGTIDELELFADTIERWDTSMKRLPDYMKLPFQALLDYLKEIEEETFKEGRPYCMQYIKEAVKRQIRGYITEARWFNQGYVPKFEEHRVITRVSTCLFMFTFETARKEVYDWLVTDPKILVAAGDHCRLLDDVTGHEMAIQGEAQGGAEDRRSAEYHPSVWGDFFLKREPEDKVLVSAWKEEVGVLKEKVRKMLTPPRAEENILEKLSLVDAVIRLGIGYHFQEEIDDALLQIHKMDEYHGSEEISTIALGIRLLRQNGYYASYLSVHGDQKILDDAREFTKKHLKCFLVNDELPTPVAEQVNRALHRPVQRNVEKFEQLQYISIYEGLDAHNEVVLKLAKLDFNVVQSLYREELRGLTEWNTSTQLLPDYMKPIFHELLELSKQLEEETTKEGRPYCIQYVKEAVKRQIRVYTTEARWFNKGYVPKFEEYRAVSGATKEVYDWLVTDPKILVASGDHCRLLDDIAGHEIEQKRGNVASAVECYMKEYGVSKEEAHEVMKKFMEDDWKCINEEFMKEGAIPIPKKILKVFLRYARIMEALYGDFVDSYNHADTNTKEMMEALLVNPIPMAVHEAADQATDDQVLRRTVDFHPCVWDDFFIKQASSQDKMLISAWSEQVEVLKEEVRKMLTEDADDTLERPKLIDAVLRLGIGYHFEKEIEEALEHTHKWHHQCSGDHQDLVTVALRFRLLRQHGYYDEKGNFMENLTQDLQGLLSLYEASFLSMQEEKVLDDALAFTTAHLKSMVSQLSSPHAKQVSDALYRPIHWRVQKQEQLNHISQYEQDGSAHSEAVLKMAKLDFNIVQALYQEELSSLSKWRIEIDFKRKVPFARDRMVEIYYWALTVFPEPEHAFCRITLTKWAVISAVLDDMHDAYATFDELQLFLNTIERWDTSMEDLPELMDDIATHEFEQKRGHVASVVECYMKEYGVSKEEAHIELQKFVERDWKIMNEELVRETSSAIIPKKILRTLLNYLRIMEALYRDGFDAFTNAKTVTKEVLTTLLVTPIPVEA
ncbi:hypothetical protein Tsubulata_044564, partial [Turnera subulata]